MAFNAASQIAARWSSCRTAGLAVVAAPACGWATVDSRDGDEGSQPVEVGDGWMENGHLRVTGTMTACSHRCGIARRRGRSWLPGNRATCFQLHEDNPKAFDAWNVDREYFDQVTDLWHWTPSRSSSSTRFEAAVRFVRTFGDSRITQVMRLAAGSRRLEFRHRGRLA